MVQSHSSLFQQKMCNMQRKRNKHTHTDAFMYIHSYTAVQYTELIPIPIPKHKWSLRAGCIPSCPKHRLSLPSQLVPVDFLFTQMSLSMALLLRQVSQ